MATNIFLGLPPPNIVKWIKDEAERKMLKTPLSFTANEDNSSVSLVCFDENVVDLTDAWCKLDYSMDGKSWQAYIDPDSADETLHRGKIISLSKGQTVYFKATLGNVEGNPNLVGFCTNYGMTHHQFIMEGSIKANGNIQFLLESTGAKTDVPSYCYSSMFMDCTYLTQAPALPATALADDCYSCMFYGCSSLTQAPALPATALAQSCYNSMFWDCISLVQAPALLAMTLARYCYAGMFWGCTRLSSINVNFSAWNLANAIGATDDWVTNVSSSGTFTCPAGLPEEFGDSKIPSGWTVVRK